MLIKANCDLFYFELEKDVMHHWTVLLKNRIYFKPDEAIILETCMISKYNMEVLQLQGYATKNNLILEAHKLLLN
jgi:hypothetical protein